MFLSFVDVSFAEFLPVENEKSFSRDFRTKNVDILGYWNLTSNNCILLIPEDS